MSINDMFINQVRISSEKALLYIISLETSYQPLEGANETINI